MMKQTIFVLVIALVAGIQCGYSRDPVGDICKWQAARDALVGQLTTNGQASAKQIMLNFQKITGPAMQPIYQHIGEELDYEIQLLNVSSDASKLAQMNYYYGVGNATFGNGPLRDMCQDAKNVEALYKSFSKQNQPLAKRLIMAADKQFKKVYPVLMSISQYLDADLYGKLMTTENATVLANLAALYQGWH